MIERDPSQYSWWLASRSAGIVAFVLISCSVMLGLYMASGLATRPGLKRTLVKIHEQLALTAIAAIVFHGLFLLGDKWLKPGLTGIVIPFTMPYRPTFTGIGIVAGYLALLLGPTYYMRRRIGTKRWRLVHRATVVVYALGLVHALGAGTDGATAWFRALAVLTALAIAALLVARYARPRRRPAPVRRSAPPAGRSSATSHG